MSSKKSIVELAKETIAIESLAISQLADFIDETFAEAVEFIYNSTGRVIITGIGKSAIIANKIVATLNSTGTPSVFMHAADAIHGDLGLILDDDVVICISKSGNTPEIKVLIPFLKNAGNTLIAITGNQKSVLAEQADFVFNSYVEKEACPINLAPTTSTTAQLVIGDALAVCLLELRGFTKDDFAKYHPGGALGKKLFLKVRDILALNEVPAVRPDASIKNVIVEISEKRKGVTAVTVADKIVGIITDGDLRRMLSVTEDLSKLRAEDIMSKNPRSITIDAMAIEAMELMDTHEISQLLVEDQGNYAGVIHIHDLIKEGII
ncbi:KpsF/GutQ family sugar-phosphate isomerase [Flavobacteriaceae bacterium]|nr:KpsF/GutQ family sugar-phosphate isomerase [Flavobacteriaceae bacterium]MDB4289613.1 KpsF/GutQ family sugar-phosphate isomerase [Flavobacteriaceae bacterium]MDC1265693.1 KpsF/GutQ family sugar-phosphate isomerase [Flavobacteriaceae bacterium]